MTVEMKKEYNQKMMYYAVDNYTYLEYLIPWYTAHNKTIKRNIENVGKQLCMYSITPIFTSMLS